MDVMDLNLNSIQPQINVADIDPDAAKWETLIEQIIAGNVIPVIGPEILVDNCNVHNLVIDAIARQRGITSKPASFSQLIYDEHFSKHDRENIYSWLHQICSTNRLAPSGLLKRLLSIKYFPFVITTSFFPTVEYAMKEIWEGRSVKTMVFSNNPATTLQAGVGDLRSEEDASSPTVYYMFGKHCQSAHRFVVTDTDMLCFCKSWLSNDTRPKVLSNVLRKKYLLVLGNNYSDWLFRFIWFSMNQNDDIASPFTSVQGMMVNNDPDEGLIAFLNRLQTFTQSDPEAVIDTIERKLEAKKQEIEAHRFDHPKVGCDVFISYSRTDQKVADRLYEVLTARGLNVWYDKFKLKSGADWMAQIERAIESSKFFVPVFSENVLNEGNSYHVYRKEWKIAAELADGYERSFIIPLAEKGFDFYNSDLSKMMKRHNAFFYEENMDLDAFADEMMDYINNL